MQKARALTRLNNSFGDGCIGLTGLLRLLVSVGCQYERNELVIQCSEFLVICFPPKDAACNIVYISASCSIGFLIRFSKYSLYSNLSSGKSLIYCLNSSISNVPEPIAFQKTPQELASHIIIFSGFTPKFTNCIEIAPEPQQKSKNFVLSSAFSIKISQICFARRCFPP